MKAIIQRKYGSPDEVLALADIDKPVPRDDEVLVRVRAASLHPDVWHVVHGVPYILRVMGAGLRKPRNAVPGTDLSGLVESVGSRATRFRPGDEIFGECVRGHQWHNGGAFAEYAAAPERKLELKPANLTFEEAAAMPTSGLIAYQAVVSQGHVEPGERVLVNGAGGGVGTFAVQIARASGASVTAVDGATKLETLKSIGADRVIDYAQEDFTRSGERYDVIIDIPGNHSPSEIRRALTSKGVYVLIGHESFRTSVGRWMGSGLPRFLKLTVMTPFVSQAMNPGISKGSEQPQVALKELAEAGKLSPVIDRTFRLDEVWAAIRYMEEGHACGKIVMIV